MVKVASEVWRKFELPGVPASGPHKPDKADIIAWGTWLETLLNGSTPGLAYATLAALNADLTHPIGSTAMVYADSNPANNGIYVKSGSWSRISDLPTSVVRLTVTGGTANDIVATAPETPTAPGNKLFLLTPDAANTDAVTIVVNGGDEAPIKNALGSQLAANSLLTDVPVLMAWQTDHYHLLVSLPVDASGILSDAIDARDAAEGFKDDAAASAAAAAASAASADGVRPENNGTDFADTAATFRNLGGLDFSAVVNLTSASTLTSAAFGKLHLITGVTAFTTTLPTAVGNAGKMMAFIVGPAASATKLFTLSTPAGSIGRSGSSIVMWASESVLLRSNGADWQVLEGKQHPFIGTLVRNTNASLSTGVAVPFGFLSASGDPTGLNLAYDGSKFIAPRAGRYSFSLYAYQTSTGASSNQNWIGNLAGTQLSGVFQYTGPVNAGSVGGTEHLTVAAGDAICGVAQVNGTGPVVAAATIAAKLSFSEILPSW
ncbi:hypothetical protein [Bradyrhizobium liaoningense]|uniref:hypothetical protein n=1 Tax=Bradyrhizobium liaoningense TaxID=43992 RepID=UPI0004B671C3|nr:hypothetical protein [Bradyrhizobium liaoningense]